MKLLFLLYLSMVTAYDYEMLYTSYCTGRSLTVGSMIMRRYNAADTSQSIKVFRSNGIQLQSGALYTQGETFKVSFSIAGSTALQRVFQTSGGSIFTDGNAGCSGTRSYSNPATLKAPEVTSGSTLSIWAGFASAESTVYITNTFLLYKAPTVSTTTAPSYPLTPSPSNPPTQLPTTRTPTSKPSGVPSNFPVAPGDPTLYPVTFAPSKMPITLKPTFRPSTKLPTLNPSVAPTTATASPTVRSKPTRAPTSSPVAQMLSIQITFNISSSVVTAEDILGANENIRQNIANALSVDEHNVVVLSIKSLELSAVANQKSMSWVEYFLIPYNAKLDSAIDNYPSNSGYSHVGVNMEIRGISTRSTAIALLTNLVQYLTTRLAVELSMFADLALTNDDVSVGNGTIASSSDNLYTSSAYDHHCALSPQLSLFWSVQQSSQSITVMLTMSGSNQWLSGGIIQDDQTKMYSSAYSAPNTVFLYAPDVSMAGMYVMEGYTSGTIIPDKKQLSRSSSKLLYVESIDGTSSLVFTQSVRSSFSTDPVLRLAASQGNSFMWAQGGVWPEVHPERGVTTVFWIDGTCQPAAKGKNLIPYLIFPAVMGILILAKILSYFTALDFLRSKRISIPYVCSELSYLSCLAILAYLGAQIAIAVAFFNSNRPPSSNKIVLEDLIKPTGVLAMMNFWMSILPTSKTSIFVTLTGVPFERAIKFHKIVVALALIASLIHLWLNYSSTIYQPLMLSVQPTGSKVIPFYGLLSVILAVSMSGMALEPIRKLKYEIFLIFHYLYLPVIVFIILHSQNFGFYPGLALHAIDYFSKISATIFATRLVDASIMQHGDIVSVSLQVTTGEISRAKALGGGCYYFLNFPRISCFEWHPFSIADTDFENSIITFHIKALKHRSFTRNLYDAIENLPPNDRKGLAVVRFGVLGALSVNLRRYKRIVLIAGGIGITPMINILQTIIADQSNPYGCTDIIVVWATRGSEYIDYFRPSLPYVSSVINQQCTPSAPPASTDMHLETFDEESSIQATLDNNARFHTRGQFQGSSDDVHISKQIPEHIVTAEIVDNVVEVEPGLRIQYRIFDSLRSIDNQGLDYNICRLSDKTFPRFGGESSQQSTSTGNAADETVVHYELVSGRPSFAGIFDEFVACYPHARDDMAVLVCGPQGMSNDVMGLCKKNQITYHSETFGY